MKEKFLKQFIKKSTDIRLSQDEKGLMKDRLDAFVRSHPAVPVSSPSWMHAHLFRGAVFAYALGVLLIVTVPTVYASGKSLPGDFLYPIKVGVVEPTSEFLTLTPEKHIQRIVAHSEERVRETALVRTDAEKTLIASRALEETAVRGSEYMQGTDTLSLEKKIDVQKDLLTAVEAHEALVVDAGAVVDDAVRETRLILEDDLIEAMRLFVETNGETEALAYISVSIEKIREKTKEPLEEDLRAVFEKGVTQAITKLSEGNTNAALRAIVLNEQDADVIGIVAEMTATSTESEDGDVRGETFDANDLPVDIME